MDDLILYDKELDLVFEHCYAKRLLHVERRDGWPALIFEDGTYVLAVGATVEVYNREGKRFEEGT